MGFQIDENEKIQDDKAHYLTGSDCGQTHEVSTNCIRSLTKAIVNIPNNCHKNKYIESLEVMSAIHGFTDI